MANDTNRSIRLPEDLAEKAKAVLDGCGLTFSEAVRMFLNETVKAGKLPFRPSQEGTDAKLLAMRKREEAFVGCILGKNDGAEERLLKAIFGQEKATDMTDDQLRDWANMTGLPKTLSITTIEDLFDSGLFARNPWSGNLSVDIDEDDPAFLSLLTMTQTHNIQTNLESTFKRIHENALNFYVSQAATPKPEINDDKKED